MKCHSNQFNNNQEIQQTLNKKEKTHCNPKHNSLQTKCRVYLFSVGFLVEKDNKSKGGDENK